MTESEWIESEDAGAMIEYLWQRRGVSPRTIDLTFGGDMTQSTLTQDETADLVRVLHRFYLASCRGIWKLLPQEASRRGVELAEQFIVGRASAGELNEFNYHVEGAAFRIAYNTEPEAIDQWAAQVRAIPEAELRSMLHPPSVASEIEPWELLKRAAYFADYAMIYPSLGAIGSPRASYLPFLSAQVLRQHIGYPTHPMDSSREG
jgi:hypothetical protein